MLNEKFQRNTLQNFPYFISMYGNPKLLYPFFIYVDIYTRAFNYTNVTRNEKWKNQLWVFVLIKYGKF